MVSTSTTSRLVADGESVELRIESGRICGSAGSLPIHADDPIVRDFLLILLREVGNVPLNRALELFGYQSRATYYAKLKRYSEGGLKGLLPRPPGPRHKWRRTPEVIESILERRRAHPEETPRQIADALAQQGHKVSMRSVERTLAEFFGHPAALGSASTPLPKDNVGEP